MLILEQQYLEKHEACGIKEGDRVRVLKKAKDFEKGWCNTWPSPMDCYIDKICIVIEDNYKNGFGLMFEDDSLRDGACFSFPYFVLEKLKKSSTINATSSCPKCNSELREVYSEWVQANIKKCNSCGWC